MKTLSATEATHFGIFESEVNFSTAHDTAPERIGHGSLVTKSAVIQSQSPILAAIVIASFQRGQLGLRTVGLVACRGDYFVIAGYDCANGHFIQIPCIDRLIISHLHKKRSSPIETEKV